jgi:hypothetical protein
LRCEQRDIIDSELVDRRGVIVAMEISKRRDAKIVVAKG